MESTGPVLLSIMMFISVISAEVMTDCQLVDILRQNDFPSNQLADWLCLAKSESALNTTAIGGPNKNGSYDFGIFQINNRWWCDMDKPGKDCNVTCSDLILDDDITPSIECAKIIFKIQGFNAWNGWKAKCKDKPLPPIYC
uniref:lysozyme n=1 Tax=Pristhesancus plagipennis TaxID=1955184 RepID=A0A2K8JUG4_PRIPG|nr:venom lysozyme 1 [Pristhesancus plagipennis]